MPISEKADLVRINGKTFTLGRARAQGLIDAKGNVTAKANRLIGDDRLNNSKPVRNRDRKAAREEAEVGESKGEPKTTTDGRLIAPKKVKPLKPKNVTKTGEVIEDEAELARIAAETAAIEAAAKAERKAKGEV